MTIWLAGHCGIVMFCLAAHPNFFVLHEGTVPNYVLTVVSGASRSFSAYGQYKPSTTEAQPGTPGQRIVFIGVSLDESSIRRVLNTCLVTNDEALWQPHSWDPWASLWDSL